MSKIHKVGPPSKATRIKIDEAWRENLVDIAFDAMCLETKVTEKHAEEIKNVLRNSFESIDLPMGISEYIAHGKKYGYYAFLKKEFLEDMGFDRLNEELKKYNWQLGRFAGKYEFIVWSEHLQIITAKTPGALWAKIEKLLKTL